MKTTRKTAARQAQAVGQPCSVTVLQCDLLALLSETTRVGTGPAWKPGAFSEPCDLLRRTVSCSGPGVVSSLFGLVAKGLVESFQGGYRITQVGAQKVLTLKERGFFR